MVKFKYIGPSLVVFVVDGKAKTVRPGGFIRADTEAAERAVRAAVRPTWLQESQRVDAGQQAAAVSVDEALAALVVVPARKLRALAKGVGATVAARGNRKDVAREVIEHVGPKAAHAAAVAATEAQSRKAEPTEQAEPAAANKPEAGPEDPTGPSEA